MSFIPKRSFIRYLLLLLSCSMLEPGTAFAQAYYNGGYATPGYNGTPVYGNQQPYYGQPPGYPVQGGYYPPPNYNYYSYPPYYSRHFHDRDDGYRYRRDYDGDHDRERRDFDGGHDRR